MNISTVGSGDGLLSISNNGYGSSKPLTAYVCRSDRKMICRINGISKFDVKAKFNDISEISFEVQRYVTNPSTFLTEQNVAYDYLHSFASIYVPELGKFGYFRIVDEPEITVESTRHEYITFTAKSYECVLEGENLLNFIVNEGTSGSIEMVSDNLDAIGAPVKKICLYNPDDTGYSLLNLALQQDKYGWTVGHVDGTLKELQRSFSIDNENLFAFLHNEVSTAFRCIFVFDTVNLTINAYDIETVGSNTNIYMSLAHLMTELNISPSSDNIYTAFNVSGKDDLDISPVNFGSNKIINVNYYMASCDPDLRTRYVGYLTFRDSKRESYENLAKDYSYLLSQKTSIEDRQPEDIIYKRWSSTTTYSLSDLQTDLKAYQELVSMIEDIYKDSSGNIDMTELNKSADAALYYSYKDVVIPDIEAEIAHRQGTSVDPAAKVDYKTIWELYGLNELETKRDAYNEQITLLVASGYDGTWDSSKTMSQNTFNAHHQEYLTYKGYVDTLNSLIADKEAQIAAIQSSMDSDLAQMKALADSVKVENYKADGTNLTFTASELELINSFYKETDYTNDNYLITEYDDTASIVVNSGLLYDAAVERLKIESRPQMSWQGKSENLFAIKDFEPLRSSLQVGNFITVNYGSDNLKFRCIEIDFDGMYKSFDFNLTFSDMTLTDAFRNDFENLLNDAISSSANSITQSASSVASTIASQVTNSLIKPYLEVINAQIQNATIDTAHINDLTAISEKVGTLLADYVKTTELSADIAKIGDLSADSAFITNLKSTFLTADSASFTNMGTDVANIKKLISGVSVAEYTQGIHLTMENATIDQALIQDLIAKDITVFDLMAGNITADKSITLVSRDGYGSIVMNNATMQFKDEDSHVRVQIGKDGTDAYSVSILSAADSNGNQTVLWNSSGITSGAIADGLIVNNMLGDKTVTGSKVADKTITKENMNWTGIAESVDANNVPTFSAGQITVDGSTLETKWSSLTSEVSGITLTASSQAFTSADGGMTYSPDTLMLTPSVQVIPKTDLTWWYSLDDGSTWIQITNITASTTDCSYDASTKVLTVPKGFTGFTATTISLVFKCAYSENGTEKYSDQMTIMRLGQASGEGSSAYGVILSNEVQAISTDEQYKPYLASTYSCEVSVYYGTTKLTAVSANAALASGQFKVSAACADSGITLDYTTTNGTILFKTSTASAIMADGVIDVAINVYGLTNPITKTISYASTKSGVDGEDGLYPHIVYDQSVNVSKQEDRKVLCTAVISSSTVDDVDPDGTIYPYTWYKRADNGELIYLGSTKSITIDINDSFCNDTAIVYFVTNDIHIYTEEGYLMMTEASEELELG
jgi:hypothetical protein